jgi:hypothetical protein
VDSFLPHARVRIYANTNELIGDQRPYVGYDPNFPLSRPLRTTDVLTATQEYLGFTSQPTTPPVGVLPQSKPLTQPAIDHRLYACGRIALVTNLNPSTHVEVFSSPATPVPTDPGHLVGSAECTGASVAVPTQPLQEAWHVVARQTSCPGTPHEVRSATSHPATVLADPSPVKPPTLDKPIVGNDVVLLHQLYVGAVVKVSDSTAPGAPSLGGGLANADDDWCPINPPVHAAPPGPAYHAWQDLCSSSGPGPAVGTTNNIVAPILVSPICFKSPAITVRRAQLNAVLGLFKEGDPNPLIFFGAEPGEFEVDLGPDYTPAVGDRLYLKCLTPVVSAESNHVTVGDCRNVITQKNDNRRTGQYLHETQLTPAAVASTRFGKLYERSVNGDIYAQPLYVRDVVVGGARRNLAFIATSTNWIYAFDADDLNTNPNTPSVWPARQLQPSRRAQICPETIGAVGVTSTPVIDPQEHAMYVVARRTSPGQDADGEHFLHAIDIRTGHDLLDPIIIAGSDHGVEFDTRCQRNRPGLLLLNGVLYIAFATFSCDDSCVDPPHKPQDYYHGWVFAYEARDFRRLGVFCTSPTGGGAGVWQSGNGVVGDDDGSVYFQTGNDFAGAPARLGDSFVKLRINAVGSAIEEVGSFTPDNARALRDGVDANGNPIVPPARQYGTVGDTDLGSGGPVLLPGNRLIGGGKQGRLYVLDPAAMTLTQDTQRDALRILGEGFQAYHNTYPAHTQPPPGPSGPPPDTWYAAGELYGPNIHGGPVFWSGSNLVYAMPEKDTMQAYPYDPTIGVLHHSPRLDSGIKPPDGMPGGFSSVSANGDNDGVIWTLYPQADGQWQKVSGFMAAFDARSLRRIYHDDSPVPFAKFCAPTIADGKVYRATFAANPETGDGGLLAVYGLHPLPRRRPPRIWPRWWRDHPWPPHWPYYFEPQRRHPDDWPLIEGGWDHVHESIEALWRHYGGGGGVVGAPSGEERELDGRVNGRCRDYVGAFRGVRATGVSKLADAAATQATCQDPEIAIETRIESSIYWSKETGARLVLADIRARWLELGGHAGPLGYPITDEMFTPDYRGRISLFQRGYILWYPHTGAEHEVLTET